MENEDATATAVPGWEAAKENVLPVKKGRSAKGLSERFARPVMGPSLEEEQEKAFEDLLRNTTVPLERFEIYSKYLKWTRDTFPSTTEKSMLILEVRAIPMNFAFAYFFNCDCSLTFTAMHM